MTQTHTSRAAVLAKLVRFERPELSLPYAGGMDAATRAAVFGATLDEYDTAVGELAQRRDVAVQRLAQRDDVREILADPPFAAGQTVVAIGESTTADRESWFELIGALFATERPDLGLRFVNLSVSGSTTTQLLGGLGMLRRVDPSIVFCMIGANDARRTGGSHAARLVSAEETRRNLALIRDAVAGVPRVWLAPVPVDEDAVARYPYFGGAGIHWTEHDRSDTARAITDVAASDPVIDPADAEHPIALLDDGVHPSADGQFEIAVHVLRMLGAGGVRRL